MQVINKFVHDTAYEDDEILVENHGKTRVRIGPHVRFNRCRVVFDSFARGISIGSVEFTDCQIVAKRRLVGADFFQTSLRRCTLTGHFTDCDFGWMDGKAVGSRGYGVLEDCDFSGSVLEDCGFLKCDLKRVILPRKWPQIVLESYQAQAQVLLEAEMLKAEKNVPLRALYSVMAEDTPECIALVIQAKRIAKLTQCTEEEVKALVQTWPFAKLELG